MTEFKNLMMVGTLCGAVALAGLAGCSWNKNKVAKETGRTPTQVSTDKSISDRVGEQLKTAPIYKYPDVHVNTFNGTVQLSGFVHNQGQKDEATRIAQSVPGVNQVRNDLVVQPLAPTGRTNGVNQPYQAPVITPPQNEGSQETTPPQAQPPQPPQNPPPAPPQPNPSTQPQPNSGSQP